jgi:hypothetical protein
MPLIELEQQALRLTLADQLHLLQVLVKSLGNRLTLQPPPPTKLSDFFRQSPLCEAVASGELDLSRDRAVATRRDRTHPKHPVSRPNP